MTQEEDLCRFCLDSRNSKQDPLITPCECRGSMRYIHTDCLRHWRLLNPGRNGSMCLLCFHAYTLSFDDVLEVVPNEGSMAVFFIRMPAVLFLFVNYIAIFHYTLLPRRAQHYDIIEGYEYAFQILYFLVFITQWNVKHKKLYFTHLFTKSFFFLVFIHLASNVYIHQHDFITGLIPMNVAMSYYWIYHKRALHAINNR
jgi:E3 ubiquitin-protein ligase DOA10